LGSASWVQRAWLRPLQAIPPTAGHSRVFSLAEVLFEQRELGNPNYGCDLAPIDFVAFAKACGADGFRCSSPGDVRAAIQATLRSPKAAVLEASVDVNEKPSLPPELKA
jgi:pyruvate dehydrogenase (quinone)